MPHHDDDRVAFHFIRENGEATHAYRHVWFEGEQHTTTFDLTDPTARVAFASSLLGYAQEILLDAVAESLGDLPRPPGVRVVRDGET